MPIPQAFNFIGETPPFQTLSPKDVEAASAYLEKEIPAWIDALSAIPDADKTFENTFKAYDAQLFTFSAIVHPIYLLANTTPNAELYEACNAAIPRMSALGNKMSLSEPLYRALKAYAEKPEAQNLDEVSKKFIADTLRGFERQGMNLPEDEREKLMELRNKIAVLSNEFSKNIAGHKDEFILPESRMAGLPEDYLENHRQEDGNYRITLDSPSYRPFMKFAEDDKARAELQKKYLNRAYPKNIDVLKEVIQLRRNLAEMLGYETYAAYRQDELMAKNPANVWEFEKKLAQKVRPKAEQDLQEVLEIKREFLQDPSASQIFSHEAGFFGQKLLKQRYDLDTEALRAYFPLDSVLDGLFHIAEVLFGIQIKEVENPVVWEESVREFKVYENEEVFARFYLDLFPREKKYGHAACFGFLPHCIHADGTKQIPVTALVCNFPKPTEKRPSLLTHGDVTTFFHEFGHLLHNILSTSPLASTAGTSVARDYVEVQSQLFENWAWHYESLQNFAKHYETNEVLPKALYDKMWNAKTVNSGIHTLQQIFYGSYDLSLHDGYDPEGDENTTALYTRLQREITLYPAVPGTHMEASFGHLMGYAASYYGYLWSLVFAEDCFGEFEKHGIFNAELGKKLRDCIYAPGGNLDEMQQLKNFLGREPQEEAFLKSIGLETA